jgi:putative FmdB family regulatory protein
VPTYDYQCRSCGHTIEVIHSMLEEGPSTCERCGAELRRVIHPTGIIFKGSGFYKTDSRGSSAASTKKAPAADGASSTTESTGGEGATKPATKPAGETKPSASS